MASSACPLCLSEIGKAASFKCPGCGSKYHKDCAADSGECIVVGCSAAAAGKKRSAAVSNKAVSAGASARSKSPAKTVNRSALVIGVIASLLIGVGAGYSAGDSAGYERGYAGGKADGYTDGYASGQSDGYASGKVDGRKEGIAIGYTAGCESVFDTLNFTSVIGYRPGLYYYRYGSVYMSKYQCP